ncbi:cytochrome c [Gemmatimonas groenlandica]|uniref:Cytochrome c n=2 Tax=Gemmatimonas groenlandica TaxID=2732249 RepID=A0A6M4IX69_9BACT|nr:cytochrome c [Gemmatimonas groenlandica]
MCTLVAVALSACSPSPNDRTDATNASFASYDAGAVPGGPGSKQSYALGHLAADSAIAAMNQDIGPDGVELPAGRGSVQRGAVVYAAQCSQCHGAKGEGLPTFPKLVGRDSAGAPTPEFQFATKNKTKTIGNYWPYATTLFDYIKRAMPFATPGSMTDDDVYAVTAFLLSANAVIPDTTTLDAVALRAIRMPARDHFVPDNRKPTATTK